MRSFHSQTPLRLDALDRAAVRSYFADTWTLYELLFSALTSDDTLYVAPDPLRHPLVFYLGHTAAFYVNKLKLAGVIERGIDEHLETLFAVGVDPERPEELAGAVDWPGAERVREFRAAVYELVQGCIDTVKIPRPGHEAPDQEPIWALLMGFAHDRIHFETSSVLIRQLDVRHTRRPEGWRYAPSLGKAEPARLIEVPAGEVRLGRPTLDMFSWDNEQGSLTVAVAPFVAADTLVTNEAFLEFVAAGGYENRELWSPAGWQWKQETGTQGPRFWRRTDRGFVYRAMFDELELPLDWPAEVNGFEAEAFCRFKGPGFRLLSEAEHRRIADEAPLVRDDSVFADCYNLNLAHGSPTPVRFLPKSSRGFHDLHGNVWQWLSNDFYPLPGFRPHRLYEEFSLPFFDDRHGMLLGGSWASTGTTASRYYRLWFRRHFFQHAGFRLAEDAP